jgi:hypothetical protein
MRFVIGTWWMMKKPPRQQRQKYFLIAVMMMMFRVVVPQSGEDDVASGEVFPSVKNQGNRTRRRFLQHHIISPYTQENKSPHPMRPRGCQALDGNMKD